ncbi:DUF3014 domain-containing protein [Frateuria defendens]|uniref:DUF3014 domain-containing protein n=1 Tax=Frateuria defendens TaxID=2219559 RepID=UPI00066FCCF2|nr:DUF3014 domain-containing protein [Frateuria defendens]
MSRQSSPVGPVLAGIVVIAAVAAGVFIWRKAVQPPPAAPPSAATSSAPAAAATAAPAVRHPIEQAGTGPAAASSAPLPALDNSDAGVSEALAALAGGGDLRALLRPDQLIRRIVATVDALPRQSLGSTSILPLRTPRGAFATRPAGDGLAVGDNTARYAPYMRIVEGADPKAVAAWYVRFYPLFQQAYRDLGYPKAYFNDRLVAAIDDMLAAPEPHAPLALARPKVLYEFADPGLQSLSVGQKLMLRLGPADEAKLKAKLRAIRAALTGATLPPAPAGSAG